MTSSTCGHKTSPTRSATARCDSKSASRPSPIWPNTPPPSGAVQLRAHGSQALRDSSTGLPTALHIEKCRSHDARPVWPRAPACQRVLSAEADGVCCTGGAQVRWPCARDGQCERLPLTDRQPAPRTENVQVATDNPKYPRACACQRMPSAKADGAHCGGGTQAHRPHTRDG